MRTVKWKRRKLGHGNFAKIHEKPDGSAKRGKITVENYYWIKRR